MNNDLTKYFHEKSRNPCQTYAELLEFNQNVKTFTQDALKDGWCSFFYEASSLIEKIANDGRITNPNYLSEKTIDELKQENFEIHCQKLPEHYKNSFANPKYSCKHFGPLLAQTNSLLFMNIVSLSGICNTYHQIYMEKFLKLYAKYFLAWMKRIKRTKQNFRSVELLKVYIEHIYKEMAEGFAIQYKMKYSQDFTYYSDWIKNANLNDLRYLFYYGNYITEDDIKTAEFLNSLPQEKIDKVMHQTAKAYIQGFDEGRKDYTKKKTVILYFRNGMERLARSLMIELETKYNLKTLIASVSSSDYSQQLEYDHRFSSAMFLDKKYVDKYIKEIEICCENNKTIINDVSGVIAFDPFGEEPFAPRVNRRAWKYTEAQIQLSKEMRSAYSQIFSKYYKRSENSFCIIGFPTPKIGKNFTEIFDQTIDINMLDNDLWQGIQQHMIDVLDKAEKVIVKGRKKNKTDIVVNLHPLKNKKTESNFANCGATVNIPVGEVFTTPKLKGTNGILHLPKTFLRELLYKNLELTFKNGRITDYNCKNYKTTEANKKYIEENLIFPHKSLPLGEFAIGTNTLAYAMAKKYKIVHLLPILIIEKMGPHFAIGDTCYSREEDTPVFNPDGKEIISRDNEQSILRKKDPMKAYTNIHLDITLPYDEIGLIQAVMKDGKTVSIIKKGKFVLEGTVELNKYMK